MMVSIFAFYLLGVFVSLLMILFDNTNRLEDEAEIDPYWCFISWLYILICFIFLIIVGVGRIYDWGYKMFKIKQYK